jgi:hypothetical protein
MALQVGASQAPASLPEMPRHAVAIHHAISWIVQVRDSVDLALSELLREYVGDDLYVHHPEGFANAVEAAEALGLTPSEVSDLTAISTIIFPWIRENLDVDPIEVYREIGKAKFRKLIPHFRAIIEGDASDKIKLEVERIKRNAIMNDPFAEDEDIAAAKYLIEMAKIHSVRGLVQEIKLGDEPPIAFLYRIIIERGIPHYHVEGDLTEEQMDILKRRMGHLADFIPAGKEREEL